MVTVGHDFLHFFEGAALVEVLLLICLVLVIFDEVPLDRPTFTVLSAFELRDNNFFLFSFLVRF
jgi:hypothetical protein